MKECPENKEMKTITFMRQGKIVRQQRCILREEFRQQYTLKPCSPRHIRKTITFRRGEKIVTQQRCVLREDIKAARGTVKMANILAESRAKFIMKSMRNGNVSVPPEEIDWLSKQFVRVQKNVAEGKPVQEWEKRLLEY